MKKVKLNTILFTTAWLIVGGAISFVSIAALKNSNSLRCNGVNMEIIAKPQIAFLDSTDINNMILQEYPSGIAELHCKAIDLRKIEEKFASNHWIANADLYFDNNNTLQINITERVPFARVFNQRGSSYYLDSLGYVLPLIEGKVIELPVFTNVPLKANYGSKYADTITKSILRISNAIQKNPFWMAQCGQIDIIDSANIYIYPVAGTTLIELGNAANMDQKLHVLQTFYKHVMAKQTFNTYSKISVAFKGQIVATKGNDQHADLPESQKAIEIFKDLVYKKKQDLEASAITKEPNTLQVEKAHENNKEGNAIKDTKSDSITPKAVMPAFNKIKQN